MRAALLIGLAACELAAAQQKRIYIANDDHTDYYWSAEGQTYRQAFIDMLDYYVALADQTAGNPGPFQSRFVCDGSFWLWEYERHTSAADWAAVIEKLRSGHISAPLTALVSCYGGTPAEAVLRGMYYAGRLERRYDLRFRMAVAMENQTHPWGLASLWAGSGARWSWKGICNCATQVPAAGDREHDIYWATGPDGQRVLMKWNSLVSNQHMGGYAECWNVWDTVAFVSNSSWFQQRYPYPVIGCFGRGWDNVQTMTDEFVTAAQALTDASRQVIVSNEEDFFTEFEPAYGAGLPAEAYSYGNEWELYCASLAEVSAGVRRAVEKLRAAEAMAAVVTLFEPAFMAGREADRDLAFMDLGLYWEHDWTGDGPVPRGVREAWQRQIAAEIAGYVDALYEDATGALGRLIARDGTRPRFYVFNPLGWVRTDVAELPWSEPGLVHVVEVASGQEVPAQRVDADGAARLQIWATDVPPVGYKVYEIRPGAGSTWADAGTIAGSVLENGRYRVTVAQRGALTGLLDKATGRELAAAVHGRWLNDLGAGSGSLTAESVGPVSITVRATGEEPLAHTTRVTLYRGGERVALRNEITENFADVRTWGFGFNVVGPQVRHEEVGAIARARRVGSGGDYALRQARYDWLTLGHFADIAGGDGAGATLSNTDCYYFRLGASTAGTLDTATPQISALAGGQVDGPGLGMQNQGGDTHFLQRFALRGHGGYDPVAAMKFALEHQNPLVCGAVSGSSPRLPAGALAGFGVSHPGVLLWAVKPAEDGPDAGWVVRLWNVGESGATATVQLGPRPIARAWRTTHIETDEGEAAVSAEGLAVSLARQQLATFRVRLGLRGDLDCDGTVDFGDINPFVLALSSPETYAAAYPGCPLENRDINGDGQFDFNDINAFVTLLSSGR